MNFLSSLAPLVAPITKLVGDMHTSDAEKITLNNKALKDHYDFLGKVMAHEAASMKHTYDMKKVSIEVVKAEATSSNILTSSWRPIVMLTFTAIIVLDSFGVLPNDLSKEVFNLLQIGLGGYVVGRSAEKVAGKYLDAKKQNGA